MKKIHILGALFGLLVVLFGLNLYYGKKNQEASQKTSYLDWLYEIHGPKFYSQRNEELIIRDFFYDRRNGFFVDVGASHYKDFSTTYYLEKVLGWTGIAVDAGPDYAPLYRKHRKNTRFFCFFVADKSDALVDFFMSPLNKFLSSSSEEWLIEVPKKPIPYQKTQVPTITLDDLLGRAGILGFDFLSMDIELAEPAALAGFSIEKHRPSLVCIEVHKQVQQEILDYFSRHHYKIIRRYEGLDPLNLYFTPIDLRQQDGEG